MIVLGIRLLPLLPLLALVIAALSIPTGDNKLVKIGIEGGFAVVLEDEEDEELYSERNEATLLHGAILFRGTPLFRGTKPFHAVGRRAAVRLLAARRGGVPGRRQFLPGPVRVGQALGGG